MEPDADRPGYLARRDGVLRPFPADSGLPAWLLRTGKHPAPLDQSWSPAVQAGCAIRVLPDAVLNLGALHCQVTQACSNSWTLHPGCLAGAEVSM